MEINQHPKLRQGVQRFQIPGAPGARYSPVPVTPGAVGPQEVPEEQGREAAFPLFNPMEREIKLRYGDSSFRPSFTFYPTPDRGFTAEEALQLYDRASDLKVPGGLTAWCASPPPFTDEAIILRRCGPRGWTPSPPSVPTSPGASRFLPRVTRLQGLGQQDGELLRTVKTAFEAGETEGAVVSTPATPALTRDEYLERLTPERREMFLRREAATAAFLESVGEEEYRRLQLEVAKVRGAEFPTAEMLEPFWDTFPSPTEVEEANVLIPVAVVGTGIVAAILLSL